MQLYSRRRFLQLAGVALAGSSLSSITLLEGLPDQHIHYGRTLRPAALFAASRTDSEVLSTLWPDSMVPVLDSGAGWYRTAGGYLPWSSVQPMKSYPPEVFMMMPHEPFWAEIAGPAATVRQHCAANAPLVARIGHGGVARIIDWLPGDPLPWYGVGADDGALLGWTQAVHWRLIQEPTAQRDVTRYWLQVASEDQLLTVRQGSEVVLRTRCSTGTRLEPGNYALEQRAKGAARRYGQSYAGVPWLMAVGGQYELAGAYWHNDFGTPVPGPDIQVPPVVAEWLYHVLSEDSWIEVI